MDSSYYKRYEPIFGEWHIVRFIGEGSFGSVFEIEREDFGTIYKAALKAITIPKSETDLYNVRAESGSEESASLYLHSVVEEMVKEFALMAKLKGQSNIVSYENHKVYTHEDQIGWDILIQMELLTPLNKWLASQKVTRRDIIKLGIDLCTALELCQKYNIIHRDIKPENIFVSDIGDFKLGDFGIARTAEKSTGASTRVGPMNYMAPEILRGDRYDSRVDTYSLGLVMYRLLNDNRLPFLPPYPKPITFIDRDQSNAKRLGGAQMLPPSHAQGRLGEIVLKACAYRPELRYDSPTVMKDALRAIYYTEEERQDVCPDGDTLSHPQQPKHDPASDTKTEAWNETASASTPPTKETPSGTPPQTKKNLTETRFLWEGILQKEKGQPSADASAKTPLQEKAPAADVAMKDQAPSQEAAKAPEPETKKAESAPEQKAAPNRTQKVAPQPEQKASANQGSVAPKTEQDSHRTAQRTKEKKLSFSKLKVLYKLLLVVVGLWLFNLLINMIASYTPAIRRKNAASDSKSAESSALIVEAVAINEENFPDGIFRNYVSENFDTDADYTLSSTEIKAVTSINVNEKKISDLTGIEYFTALQWLYCWDNQLMSLNISNNIALQKLNCDNNQLASLDVSSNTTLRELHCSNNQLTSLDVSNNAVLQTLSCSYNQLTNLDVSNNTALIDLYCEGDQLTSLDVSNNTALQELSCWQNQLASLDVSNNMLLRTLDCGHNQLAGLDISNNTALQELYCVNNQLTSLDISQNLKLTHLYCSGNQLDRLDVSYNTQLTDENLDCDDGVAIVHAGDGTASQSAETSESTAANSSSQVASSAASSQSVASKTEIAASTLQSTSSSQNTVIAEGIAINSTNFPDENFRGYVSANCDTDGNGYLSDAEITNVKGIEVRERKISNLKGVEYFTALRELYCSDNQLMSLDITNNPSVYMWDYDDQTTLIS